MLITRQHDARALNLLHPINFLKTSSITTSSGSGWKTCLADGVLGRVGDVVHEADLGHGIAFLHQHTLQVPHLHKSKDYAYTRAHTHTKQIVKRFFSKLEKIGSLLN
jgi:hypothetical protein